MDSIEWYSMYSIVKHWPRIALMSISPKVGVLDRRNFLSDTNNRIQANSGCPRHFGDRRCGPCLLSSTALVCCSFYDSVYWLPNGMLLCCARTRVKGLTWSRRCMLSRYRGRCPPLQLLRWRCSSMPAPPYDRAWRAWEAVNFLPLLLRPCTRYEGSTRLWITIITWTRQWIIPITWVVQKEWGCLSGEPYVTD